MNSFFNLIKKYFIFFQKKHLCIMHLFANLLPLAFVFFFLLTLLLVLIVHKISFHMFKSFHFALHLNHVLYNNIDVCFFTLWLWSCCCMFLEAIINCHLTLHCNRLNFCNINVCYFSPQIVDMCLHVFEIHQFIVGKIYFFQFFCSLYVFYFNFYYVSWKFKYDKLFS